MLDDMRSKHLHQFFRAYAKLILVPAEKRR